MNSDFLLKIKKRDPETLKKIISEVNPYIIRFLASQKVPQQIIEDIVQASWATFFDNTDRFEERSQLKVFIAGIALNKLREWRRQNNRQVPEEDIDLMLSASFTPEGWWKVLPQAPDEAFFSKELGESILNCMEGLSEMQRQAFYLKEVEGEETAAICKTLNISVSHLGVLIFRAREKLRMCLKGQS